MSDTKVSVSSLAVYPVKSTQALSLPSLKINPGGPWLDRQFMVCDAKGVMMTARKYSELLSIKATPITAKDNPLSLAAIQLSHPTQADIHVAVSDFSMAPIKTHVWKDDFSGYTTTVALDNWLSNILKQPVHLVYSSKDSPRFSQKAERKVSFADAYPLLLISEASVAELNKRCPRRNQVGQFRPNVVIKGAEAFAEDSWQRIRIGEVEFIVSAPCQRCVLITFDTENNCFHPQQEPLRTLATFRKAEGSGVMFGVNLTPLNEGVIRFNDALEVLETQDPINFRTN